jgi:endo-1,4-beta-xylanase
MGNSDWTKIAGESINSVYVAGSKGYLVHGFKGVQVSVKELNDNFSQSFSLQQNYPNPFSTITTINYHIPLNSFVTLKVFDIFGREVRTLINKWENEGNHSLNFNAGNLPSGFYFYEIQAGPYSKTKKLFVAK